MGVCFMQKYLPLIIYYGSALLLFTKNERVTADPIMEPDLSAKFQEVFMVFEIYRV